MEPLTYTVGWSCTVIEHALVGFLGSFHYDKVSGSALSQIEYHGGDEKVMVEFVGR